ncbi:hypothetical protein [Mycobacterium sp. CnD-18-1]|uniref:hypothetical protein n=1 Tax=Mycobacterium sp. CnD-18-1 TaxID=2917744 RepID=UPI001EF17597|nr:hypothetical protein [Mycobacterium sp. CnD-18-1]MCG7610347.1 hypothetical protein [Mycobacterium sp. CnD-18-1]
MALATPADVAAALGRTLTPEETARANQLLAIATEAVSAATGGYRFEPGAYTVCRAVRDGRIRLPAKVASVSTVSAVDTATGAATPLTGWELHGNTVYAVKACTAEVAFTVTDAVPDVIVALVAGVAAATLSRPQSEAHQLVAGQFSVSFAESSGRVWFSKSDKAILSRYRPPKPAVSLL